MAKEERHIIRKQVLDLILPDERQASEWQRKISKLYQNEVLPALNKAFAELKLGEATLRIPRLEIDLGIIQTERLEKDFPVLCIQAIVKQIKDRRALLAVSEIKQEEKIVSPQEAAFEYFFFFLEHGNFPWNARHVSLATIQTEIHTILGKNYLDFITSLKKLFRKNPASIRRLTRQFPQEWVAVFTAKLCEISKKELDYVVKQLKIATQQQGQQFSNAKIYEKIFQMWSEDGITTIAQAQVTEAHQFFTNVKAVIKDSKTNDQQVIERLIKEQTAHSSSASGKPLNEQLGAEKTAHAASLASKQLINRQLAEEKTAQSFSLPSAKLAVEQSIFIDNAGLVLLAPYVQLFFEALQFTKENTFVSQDTQERAVHVLQYLATREENPEEHVLLLNKILCNLLIQNPIERFITLADEEKEESEHLLKSVIRNWGGLGNTSPDGLREGFLKRTAKLSYKDDHWLLQVERKSIDILLEKLPWGFSIIKLPWMQTTLHTEWV